jgi:type II secretory pathway component GspD/PulD (secretin)
MKWPCRFIPSVLFLALAAISASADSATRVSYLKPQYLPPAELAGILGAHEAGGVMLIEWHANDGTHSVELRRNDAANLLMVSGASNDVSEVEALAKAADVPPRQIAIQARIVEVDENRAHDLGIDWSNISIQSSAAQDYAKTSEHDRFDGFSSDRSATRRLLAVDSRANLFTSLQLLEQEGAAHSRNAPRILTLNNRRATILDGQRVTYVTRYSSFTNLFATDSMDAGLRLSVLPSLGESGYLTLDLRAELTSLGTNISGSPVKDGQIVENTVVVKDGDTVLLGGFTRTSEQHSVKRFPVLGSLLPFLFSRDVVTRTTRQNFVLITPHVVDLTGGVDPKIQGIIDHQ